MVGSTLRAKRAAAGIAGILLCRKAGISRSRLSEIERETAAVTPDELVQLNAALDELICAKSEIRKTAAAVGWPGAQELVV
jgi:transcriptional regulator with XRE-family HTH domain